MTSEDAMPTSQLDPPLVHRVVPSPLGPLTLIGRDEVLHGLHLPTHRHAPVVPPDRDDTAFAEVAEQLAAYFAGARTRFDVALELAGTPFQRSVWSALAEIPYGRTSSYGELARRIGAPRASRAVGLANGRNPVPIIVPCHRVVGAGGALTGYGGGLEAKRLLLGLEERHAGLRLL